MAASVAMGNKKILGGSFGNVDIGINIHTQYNNSFLNNINQLYS